MIMKINLLLNKMVHAFSIAVGRIDKASFTCSVCGENKTFKSERMRDIASKLHVKKYHGLSRFDVKNSPGTFKKQTHRI